MRISSNMYFDQGVRGMGQRQDSLYRLQEQLTTGKRVNRPSDDPVAAAQMQNLAQSQERTKQFIVNGQNATSNLGMSETQLGNAVQVIQDTIQLAVQAGNTSLGDRERKMLAVEVENRYKQLLSIANSDNGNGVYLYSGFQGTTRPFVETAPGVVSYVGDQGSREMQIDASRSVAVSDNGNDIFMRIRNGNGSFVTGANPANTGTGTIDSGSVANPGALTGNNYQISFSVSGGVTQYSVTNTTTSAVVVPPTNYQAGAGITVDGMSFNISGQPAAGDSFTLGPSTSQSLFSTLATLANALKLPAANDPAASARQQMDRSASLNNLQTALTNVLKVQTNVGSRLKEIENMTDVNESMNLQYESSISVLRDLDYAKAVSDFTQAQTTLQAAQKTFQLTQNLSLFNYI